MKKIIASFTALAWFVFVLTGCSSFSQGEYETQSSNTRASPLSQEEYKAQSAKQIDGYLYEYYSVLDEANYFDDSDADIISNLKEPFENFQKKADEYLNNLEELKPPEEMRDFHEEILDLIETVRTMEEGYRALFDSKDEDEFNKANEKIVFSMEKMSDKLNNFIDDNEWLIDELEGGDFMNALNISAETVKDQRMKSKVVSANTTAQAIINIAESWAAELLFEEGRVTTEDGGIIIIEGRIDKGEWIGNISAPGFETDSDGNAGAVEKLKQMLVGIHEGDFSNDVNFDVSAAIWVSGRKIVGCAYSKSGMSAAELTNMFTLDNFDSYQYTWADIDGVTENGNIIGTCPHLTMRGKY